MKNLLPFVMKNNTVGEGEVRGGVLGDAGGRWQRFATRRGVPGARFLLFIAPFLLPHSAPHSRGIESNSALSVYIFPPNSPVCYSGAAAFVTQWILVFRLHLVRVC